LCRSASKTVPDWEIIADNLSKAGWSWGYVSAIDSNGERSGLLRHIATTESVSLVQQLAFGLIASSQLL
jgi:hypothetical protein